jgi:tRNA(fMet)-specific endonuclease VapC
MTGSSFLLDTNIISAWLKGEPNVVTNIDNAAAVFIPVITIGELYYGASCSTHAAKNIADIQDLSHNYTVLSISEQTTPIYGSIKSALRQKGRPIPENDIWIAAIALQYDLILVSRDKHFREIFGLPLVSW